MFTVVDCCKYKDLVTSGMVVRSGLVSSFRSIEYRDHMMIFCWCEWVRSEVSLASRAESHDMGTKPSPAREQRLLHSLVRWCAPRRQSSTVARQSPRLRRHQRPLPLSVASSPSLALAGTGCSGWRRKWSGVSRTRARELLRWVAALLCIGAPPVTLLSYQIEP